MTLCLQLNLASKNTYEVYLASCLCRNEKLADDRGLFVKLLRSILLAAKSSKPYRLRFYPQLHAPFYGTGTRIRLLRPDVD